MTRKSLMISSRREPKYAIRKHNRCPICGRPRAYIRKFNMCRICFRKLALEGRVPGVIKASW